MVGTIAKVIARPLISNVSGFQLVRFQFPALPTVAWIISNFVKILWNIFQDSWFDVNIDSIKIVFYLLKVL